MIQESLDYLKQAIVKMKGDQGQPKPKGDEKSGESTYKDFLQLSWFFVICLNPYLEF